MAACAVLIGLAGISLVAAAAPGSAAAQQGVVTTRDGRQLEGEIRDVGSAVTITHRGVTSQISKDDVASVDYATFAQRIQDRLAAALDGDVAARIEIAGDALGRKEYTLALQATDAALAIDPLDRDARRMANTIAQQMQLDRATTRRSELSADPSASSAEPPVGRRRTLDAAQINRLRQLELRPGDRVRIRFNNNVRRRFADSQAGLDIRAFIRREETEQALEILALGTRDMVDDVQVLSDPLAIETFGRRIHTAVLQGCATAGCHGGESAGDFRLITGRQNAETMLTNFYLLNTYVREVARVDDPNAARDARSPFAASAVYAVERGRATSSLLYQYALPRKLATTRHPAVRGWDGVVRSVNDRLARDLVQWMDGDLAAVRPDYEDISFTLPARRAQNDSADDAASEPTTQPAPGAAE